MFLSACEETMFWPPLRLNRPPTLIMQLVPLGLYTSWSGVKKIGSWSYYSNSFNVGFLTLASTTQRVSQRPKRRISVSFWRRKPLFGTLMEVVWLNGSKNVRAARHEHTTSTCKTTIAGQFGTPHHRCHNPPEGSELHTFVVHSTHKI